MERGVIYTAIAGGKDHLVEPQHVIPGVRYICFTDDPALTSKTWRVKRLTWTHPDPVRMAKRPKLLPHEYLRNFDWSLWIDGNVAITGDMKPMIDGHLSKGSFFAFKHFKRMCAYEEADSCIRFGKDDPDIIRAQQIRYRKAGMPEGRPMPTNIILLRRHMEPGLVPVMQEWWSELKNGSRRDQLSLPYVLWRTKVPFQFFFNGEGFNWNRVTYIKRMRHAIYDKPIGSNI